MVAMMDARKEKAHRASEFGGKQRGRRDVAHDGRPQTNLNGLSKMRKRLFRWMHSGR